MSSVTSVSSPSLICLAWLGLFLLLPHVLRAASEVTGVTLSKEQMAWASFAALLFFSRFCLFGEPQVFTWEQVDIL